MKNKPTHTPTPHDVSPLPWEIDEQGIVWSDENIEVSNTSDLGEANAAYIVLAVNCHEELVSILQSLEDRIRKNGTHVQEIGLQMLPFLKRIQEAIAKAEAA